MEPDRGLGLSTDYVGQFGDKEAQYGRWPVDLR